MVEGRGFIMQNRLLASLPFVSSALVTGHARIDCRLDRGGGGELATSRSIASTKRRRVLPTEDIFEKSSRKLIMQGTSERDSERERETDRKGWRFAEERRPLPRHLEMRKSARSKGT